MPYIPHTPEEERVMLETIGISDREALFDEIPTDLICGDGVLDEMPEALSESALARLMHERATQDQSLICFAGGGAYDHHIPAAVWELATRGEFYSAYTPYQAEASQGTLQLIYEYQTMMARLTAMEVSNASLYDGATALGEAILMAVRANRKVKGGRVLIPSTVHPAYREVARTMVAHQGVVLETIDYNPDSGLSDIGDSLAASGPVSAVVIPQPNYFGCLEAVDQITDWAHGQHGLVIGIVNPLSLAILRPPGEWGEAGADIVCGDGQPLGIPMSSGGPYFGFICCRQSIVRQMPGRIVGRTVDLDGKEGFTLTLQAREQHIRRAKATSNICTNQGLMVTAATIHMSLMGPHGLQTTAASCHEHTRSLVKALTAIKGVTCRFPDTPFFHECVLDIHAADMQTIYDGLIAEEILGGIMLQRDYSNMQGSLLVCATEQRSPADIEYFARVLSRLVTGGG